MERYDAIIIGFGKGGKTLAGKLAANGKSVALIEKSDRMYGGTCINVGCIPSKSLVRNSGIARLSPDADFTGKSEWYRKAVEEKRSLTGMLRRKNFNKLNDMELITIYRGTASFVSNTVVKIASDSDTFEIEGEKIFINTGSTPYLPPVKGLKENPYVYTSETLMELEELPRRLVIIGGGYIGLEFASMYAGFGSEVTVLQDAPQFLPREDRDIAEEIKKVLEQKGITFKLGVKIEQITDAGKKAAVSYLEEGTDRRIEAEAVLAATGRTPNTEGLNAGAAGVSLTARGAVVVDDNLKTTASNIWALGDVTGGLQFTYVSLDDFRIIWSWMNGGTYTAAARRNVPYSVFISPSYSRVGLNEQEAVEAGYQVKVKKLPAAAVPKAQVLKEPAGLLKVVIEEGTNLILGAMLFCEESYETINIIKLAMDLEADYHILKEQIYTHPTMSEALNDLLA